MADSSPAVIKNISETTATATKSTTTATAAAALAAAAAATPLPPPPPFQRMDTPPKTQRGLNKPKCIQCGNVARSRCPYRSCKSCCSNAQNPCHIHVLKSNSAFPEKTSTSSTPSSDQKSTQASSQVTPLRVPSYWQLSSAFAQFDKLQVRTKKHLTRKDAVALNEWRYSKLKEFKDRNIEIENDAFDRYMQNITLLEEVFSTELMDEESKPCSTSQEDEALVMVSAMKLELRSNAVRTDNTRKRVQQIVDQGIKKLQKIEPNDGATDPDDQNKFNISLNKEKPLWVERSSTLSNIIDKLNKARNEEDIKSCLEMKAQLYNQSTMSTQQKSKIPKHGMSREQRTTQLLDKYLIIHPENCLHLLQLIKKVSTKLMHISLPLSRLKTCNCKQVLFSQIQTGL